MGGSLAEDGERENSEEVFEGVAEVGVQSWLRNAAAR